MDGFIIIRCIRTKEQDNMWIENYNCIRKCYPENPILIIDDNSNKLFISEIPLHNTTVIESEFKGAGELLPYYYFFKLNPFEKAIILHDSMFVHQPIDFKSVTAVKFLWYFKNHQYDDNIRELNFIKLLDNHDELIKCYKSKEWYGCFGVASVVTYEYVKMLNDKYNFFVLVNHIKTRPDRQCMERVFAVIAFLEGKNTLQNSALYGDIHSYPGNFNTRFNDYLKMSPKPRPVCKVWCGR